MVNYFDRFRERQKSEGIVLKKPSKVLTRKEREKKREYWRVKQQVSRKKRHPQKIRRKNEKDREIRLKVKIQKLQKKCPRKKVQVRETLLETLKNNHVARRMAVKKLSILKKF